MLFPKPSKRQTKESLTHSKNARSWQGDLRKKDSEQGFVKAGRVSVTHGTRQPTNVKSVDLPSMDSASTARSRDVTGCRPIPQGHRFQPAFQRDLTDQQMQMLSQKQRNKHHKNKSTK